jgi:hypothetical protein
MRIISAITQANPAEVTTTFAHQYISGIIVRLDIPPACGMQQLSAMAPSALQDRTGVFEILVTGATTFTIPIDTTLFDVFAIPVAPLPQTNTCAMVVPVGEISSTLKAATINILNPNQVFGG